MKIQHIVFDIGQVLIHWDPDYIYRDLIPNAGDRAYFLTNICNPAWNVEQDRGRDWKQAEDILISQHPDQEHLIRAFRSGWIESIPHAIQSNVDLMQNFINQGLDVTLLTNFNHETYPLASKKYPFLDKARGVTVSGEVKLIKPDPAIYNLHAEEFDLNPASILFIDDSAKNVQGAMDCGWNAVQFVDSEQLKSQLEAYDFL